MTDAPTPPSAPAATTKKRGPKSRAEIEAELRAELEAEIRAETEAKIRAEVEAEAAQKATIVASANDSSPVSGMDLGDSPQEEGAVTINFVEDGLTILGKVWYRGETLSLVPGTPNWEEAHVNLSKKDHTKILFALMTEDQQIVKWGKRYFREGVWTGVRLDQINDDLLTEGERAQLEKAQRLHDEKFGAVVG